MLKINNNIIGSIYIHLADGSSKSVSKIYSGTNQIFLLFPSNSDNDSSEDSSSTYVFRGKMNSHYSGDGFYVTLTHLDGTSATYSAPLDDNNEFVVYQSDISDSPITSFTVANGIMASIEYLDVNFDATYLTTINCSTYKWTGIDTVKFGPKFKFNDNIKKTSMFSSRAQISNIYCYYDNYKYIIKNGVTLFNYDMALANIYVQDSLFCGTATGDFTWAYWYNGNYTYCAVTPDSDGYFTVSNTDYKLGDVGLWCMFYNQTNLTTVNMINIDTSNITQLTDVFYGCSNLTTVNGLKNWDTSNVQSTARMFLNCSSLKTINLSNWNTPNLTNTWGMFANCSKIYSLNLSNFDPSNVTNCDYMFTGCESLTLITCKQAFKDWCETNKDNIGLTDYWNNISWTIVS